MDLELDNLCRICLINDRDVIDLMKTSTNSTVSYLGKLQACVPSLNISESDPYPKTICPKCVQLLDIAFEFCLLCIESDSKLRNPMEKLIIKMESNDDEDFEANENIALSISVERSIITKRKKHIPVYSPRKNPKCYDENGKRIYKKRTPKYECDICGKMMFGKTAMEQHLRVHTGERPFVCEHCGKSYSTYGHYKFHFESHNPNQEKRYKCTICGYQTANTRYFKRHTIIHTGERPYTCNICSKSFNRDSTLYTHMKNIHSKPSIPCEFCEIKFNTHRGLRRHIICHFREVQYSCTECRKLYAKHDSLVYHMKQKHPGVKWPKERDALVKNTTGII